MFHRAILRPVTLSHHLRFCQSHHFRIGRPMLRFKHTEIRNDSFSAGNNCLLNGDFHTALGHYNSCAYINDEVLNNMGACYAHLKQYDLACKAYQDALQLNSNSFESNYNLGCLYHILDDTNKSINFFKKSYELQPTHQSARKNYLAMLHKSIKEDIASKKYQLAHKKLNEIIKYDEYVEYGLTEKGRLYLEQEAYAKALVCLKQAMNFNPEYDTPKQLYAKTLKGLLNLPQESIPGFEDGITALLPSQTNNAYKPEM